MSIDCLFQMALVGLVIMVTSEESLSSADKLKLLDEALQKIGLIITDILDDEKLAELSKLDDRKQIFQAVRAEEQRVFDLLKVKLTDKNLSKTQALGILIDIEAGFSDQKRVATKQGDKPTAVIAEIRENILRGVSNLLQVAIEDEAIYGPEGETEENEAEAQPVHPYQARIAEDYGIKPNRLTAVIYHSGDRSFSQVVAYGNGLEGLGDQLQQRLKSPFPRTIRTFGWDDIKWTPKNGQLVPGATFGLEKTVLLAPFPPEAYRTPDKK